MERPLFINQPRLSPVQPVELQRVRFEASRPLLRFAPSQYNPPSLISSAIVMSFVRLFPIIITRLDDRCGHTLIFPGWLIMIQVNISARASINLEEMGNGEEKVESGPSSQLDN